MYFSPQTFVLVCVWTRQLYLSASAGVAEGGEGEEVSGAKLQHTSLSPAAGVPAASAALLSAPGHGHSSVPAVTVHEDRERCSCFCFNFKWEKEALNS